jgi:hypothetical protein
MLYYKKYTIMYSALVYLFKYTGVNIENLHNICIFYPQNILYSGCVICFEKQYGFLPTKQQVDILMDVLKDIEQSIFLGDIWLEYEKRHLEITYSRVWVPEIWIEEDGLTWTVPKT